MKFSIIVPVYQEEQNINRLIEHIQTVFKGYDYEIIVVDGGPDADTIAKINAFSVNLKKMVTAPGRAIQMNKGASSATGGILIFLHADTFLPRQSPGQILDTLELCDLGSFSIRFATKNMYIRLAAIFANIRAAFLKMPYGDNTFFLRKDTFDKLGGFKEIPIMEDVDFVKRARKAGLKLKVLKEKVLTSARRWEKEGMFFYAMRNLFLITVFSLGIPPRKLQKYYKA